jgi:ubiquinone biosynthesis protein UbiJ
VTETRGLAALFADFLAQLTNASLRLDPASADRLRTLDGRSVRLEVIMPGQTSPGSFTLIINDGRIDLHALERPNPNVIARGRLEDFIAWFASPGHPGDRAARISINGDEAVLAEITSVFRRFRPALPGPLNDLLGSPLADNMLSLAEAAMAALRSAADGVGSAARHEVASRYVSTGPMSQVLDQLDDLRLRADRLAARVAAEETRRRPE